MPDNGTHLRQVKFPKQSCLFVIFSYSLVQLSSWLAKVMPNAWLLIQISSVKTLNYCTKLYDGMQETNSYRTVFNVACTGCQKYFLYKLYISQSNRRKYIQRKYPIMKWLISLQSPQLRSPWKTIIVTTWKILTS